MNRFACPLFAGLIFALAQTAHGAPAIRIADPSLCIDGMETDPGSNDSETILAATDDGCTVQPLDTISI